MKSTFILGLKEYFLSFISKISLYLSVILFPDALSNAFFVFLESDKIFNLCMKRVLSPAQSCFLISWILPS